MKDNPSNPQMPEQEPISLPTSPKPRMKKSILFTIIAVIVVVIVVVAVSIIIYKPSSSPSSSASTHLAFIPINKVENLTGTTLTQSTVSYSGTSTYAITKGEITYYNSSSGGHIMIMVAQFSNVSEASNFYKTEISTASKTTSLINSTFNGFNYAYKSVSFSDLYEGLAIGHNGQFVFLILDINIPISNFNALIQYQITAMT